MVVSLPKTVDHEVSSLLSPWKIKHGTHHKKDDKTDIELAADRILLKQSEFIICVVHMQ